MDKIWSGTIFLPKTDLPMKANLPIIEKRILENWESTRLYEKTRESRKGRELFILHDGPPYANGDIHMGHAMNKILKDIIIRSQTLLGKDAPYTPGWDCHGLPIEWKVHETYKCQDKMEFREKCREYANTWVNVQREQFKRLGVMADWDNPYLTMNYESEAAIVSELYKFAIDGKLYRGVKPVLWSTVEETALAEAEVEYNDIISTQIDVMFKIIEASNAPDLIGAHIVIWTTTPWTLPTNQALAYGENIEYTLTKTEDNLYLIVATKCLDSFAKRINKLLHTVSVIQPRDLIGVKVMHPMHNLGGFFSTRRPLIAATFVTTDMGTGLSHISPDHGEDDFILCKKYGIDPVCIVESNGMYSNHWLWLGGQGNVINKKFNDSKGPICSDLRTVGALLSASSYNHSYPHSWRSKAPLIFRCTPQWFIPISDSLRNTALKEITSTTWLPPSSDNRISSMIKQRPDWLISRQRTWGVPIALYINKSTGHYLNDSLVYNRIVTLFSQHGSGAWFIADHKALIHPHNIEDYMVINDILDVWFDSGTSHVYVVENKFGKGVRANMYVEGLDQHRGWFQSSLLERCATQGQAPFEIVLTHGFVLDQRGHKMSKSIGNVVDPLHIIEEYGADILRIWVAFTEYTKDVRIGKSSISTCVDSYRKIRNTLRYILASLDSFSPTETVPVSSFPPLEQYILYSLHSLNTTLLHSLSIFDINLYIRSIYKFMNEDLSAFLFEIRKDSLYNDSPHNPTRRSYRTLLDILFHSLIRYIAPILSFTAEEFWLSRFPLSHSVHLLEWPKIPTINVDSYFITKWDCVRQLRRQVMESLENARTQKIIRSSLQASVTIPNMLLSSTELRQIFIVADVSLSSTITVSLSLFTKCDRCLAFRSDINSNTLCSRCQSIITELSLTSNTPL